MEQDWEEAVKWFRLSAEQDFPPAQLELGLCYKNGTGVEQNEEEAMKWIRLAADQGLEEALSALESGD